MKKFTKIKDISDSRRMPRLSKIRLGAKVEKTTGSGQNKKTVEYPVELPFFLLPDEVAAVHGGKIKDPVGRAKDLGLKNGAALEFIKNNGQRLAEELPVMIPVEDITNGFPQAYKMYGQNHLLKCIGDGETGSETDGKGNWKDKKCPCPNLKTDENPKGQCSIRAHLQIILPGVSMGGVYQIDTGSINSIIDINSYIDDNPDAPGYLKSLVGRVAMIPITLYRQPTETNHDGKKQLHWTLKLRLDANFKQIVQMKRDQNALPMPHDQLPEPDYTDPKSDPVDMKYEQPDDIKQKLEELHAWALEKKVLKSEGQAIAEALENEDDEAIRTIHAAVLSRNTGQTQDQTADKLKQQSKQQAGPQANDQEPPTGDQEPPAQNKPEPPRF